MHACKFAGARVIGAPRDWDQILDGECGSIFVTDSVEVQSGMNIMYSVYKPTDEEIEALRNGGLIRLGIMGKSHPVFQLGVLGPKLTEIIDPEPMWSLGDVIDKE